VKNWLRFLATGSISVFALWLALRQVAFVDVAESLVHAHPFPLVCALAALAVTMWSKAERWRWLLDTTGQLPRRPLILSLFIGYLGNVVLPARLGEAMRAYSVGQIADVYVPAALSTIIVEKILDIGTLLAFLWGLGLLIPLPPWAVRASFLGGVIFLPLMVIMVAIALVGDWLLMRLSSMRQRLPARLRGRPWWRWLVRFMHGFRSLRSRRAAGMVLWWSLVVWVSGGAINLFVLMAFGIQPLLPATVLTLVTTNLGMALPSVPGYIGVHHYLSMLAISAFPVPKGLAFGYAVVVHAFVFGSFAVGGFLALALTGLDWQELRVRASQGSSLN